MEAPELCRAVRQNCDISDATHSGSYSVCTLVLKLRNLFKWEHGLEPWQEPEPKNVLDWIEEKENHWERLDTSQFQPLPVDGRQVEPFAVSLVNRSLRKSGSRLYYGAGYGRGLKPVFFLSEMLRQTRVEGYPVTILGRDYARDLASPFAMVQDGCILIRREPLRFFLYDQIRDIRCSGQEALNRSLSLYGVMDRNGKLSSARLAAELDTMVEGEMMAFIFHEVGELQKSPLDRKISQRIALSFPGSVLEFTTRGVHDVLADTAENGMLGYILREKKEASLGFYIAFLDGMRLLLFPEIKTAIESFLENGDWEIIKAAVAAGRQSNLERAALIREHWRSLEAENQLAPLATALEEKLLKPLGLSANPAEARVAGPDSEQSSP